jgi:hypothetical protein
VVRTMRRRRKGRKEAGREWRGDLGDEAGR